MNNPVVDKLIDRCDKESDNGIIKVTGHHYPDVDSLVSMYLMSTILNLMGMNAEPVISCSSEDEYKTYEELTSYSTREVMKFLEIPADTWKIEADPQHVLLVDQQANSFYPGVFASIDHRDPQGPVNDWDIVRKSSSCAFLICDEFSLLQENEKDTVEKVAVATILDTMYLRSEKLIPSEFNRLDELVDMRSLTKRLMEIAIQPPDLDDAFDNIKEYQIVERAPDSQLTRQKRFYPPFYYSAVYLELNSESQSVDDVPYSEIVSKMEEFNKNILFCLYDYFHLKTMFIIRAKFYGMKDYIVYSETLNGIKPRGTFLKGYIEKTVMPKMAMAMWNKSVEETEKHLASQSEVGLSSSVTAMLLCANASSNGLITSLHTRAIEKATPQNSWMPNQISMVEFQGKYYGLDMTGTTRTIIAYDKLPEDYEE